MTQPCKDCQNRKIGCHGECTKYADYRVENEKEKQARRDFMAGKMNLQSYAYRGY